MWVQAIDGKFYRDPVIILKDVFFHCEDDLPEVACRLHDYTPARAKIAMLNEIKAAGLNLKIGKRNMHEDFWPGTMDTCLYHTWDVDILGPIPVPAEGFGIAEPMYDERVIGFETQFDTTVIVDALLGIEQDSGLTKALFGRDHYKLDMAKMKGQLAKTLYSQHPWLSTVTRTNKSRILNTQPRRLAIKWRQQT